MHVLCGKTIAIYVGQLQKQHIKDGCSPVDKLDGWMGLDGSLCSVKYRAPNTVLMCTQKETWSKKFNIYGNVR